jgi:uncharacterized protein YdaU (DUF1376 family)
MPHTWRPSASTTSMEAAINYYEHHLGDYMRDTAHLSMLEDGAYRRLLDAYYIKERPLPKEIKDVFRLVRASSKQDREAVEAVLREFFVVGEDGWRHRRCDAEIERFKQKSEKAKKSAEARWNAQRPQSDGNANAYADAMRTHCEGDANALRRQCEGNALQTPDTSNSVANATALERSAKDRVWSIGPALLGEKSRGLLGQLVASHGEEVVAEALDGCAVEQPGEPRAWLVKACQAIAKRRVKADPTEGDARPRWALDAGFKNRFEANNEGCFEHNAHQFRNGVKEAA